LHILLFLCLDYDGQNALQSINRRMGSSKKKRGGRAQKEEKNINLQTQRMK
jgi:hypothetical protein